MMVGHGAGPVHVAGLYAPVRTSGPQDLPPFGHGYIYGTHSLYILEYGATRVVFTPPLALFPPPRTTFPIFSTLPQEPQEQGATRVIFAPPIALFPQPALQTSPILATLPQESQEQAWSFVYAPIQVPATPPPPVVVPPVAAGGGGGVLGKRRRKDGPYMREGQVFGEAYAISPQAGPKVTRTRDARGRYVKGLETGSTQRDTQPVWSIVFDTTFTDLDE